MAHGPYLAHQVPVPPMASGWWFMNGTTIHRPGTVRWITVSSMCQWPLLHVRNSSRIGRAWSIQPLCCYGRTVNLPCMEQQPHWPWLVLTDIVLLWSNCELAMYGTAAALAVAGPYCHCAATVNLRTCHVRYSSRIGRAWSVARCDY